MRRSRPRKLGKVITIVGAAAVLSSLFALTYVSSWSPLAHVECVDQHRIVLEQLWTPVVLANSPFGGTVYDNGTIPPYIPGAPGYPNLWSARGAPSVNGTASAASMITNVSIVALGNTTVWGPGANRACAEARAITYLPLSGGALGIVQFGPIATPSNLSDRGEATNATPGAPSFVISNGFSVWNAPSVTTCGGPAVWRSASSPDFTAWAPDPVGDETSLIPVTLPFADSFHYWFPANFGTWLVDNLSAPGGPGGGWAFSYEPCPP